MHAFALASSIELRRQEMKGYLIIRILLLLLVGEAWGVLWLAQAHPYVLLALSPSIAYLVLGMVIKYVTTKHYTRRTKAELLKVMDIHTSNPTQARAEASAWVETHMKSLPDVQPS